MHVSPYIYTFSVSVIFFRAMQQELERNKVFYMYKQGKKIPSVVFLDGSPK